eukprot:CAMPEP_0194139862 /NCGR_PEP_ID=MMETSP0152-20130528/9456_1 /TAXON_ID=1049557 /ORGANISM="Thalassiothrix antarctica, Strain L6-D1" /LENGTH=393 /DNA_ID=CAMNT_0038837841 /DNA_START=177 /DNA_END=1358 /DNA_ORIENTATION=+
MNQILVLMIGILIGVQFAWQPQIKHRTFGRIQKQNISTGSQQSSNATNIPIKSMLTGQDLKQTPEIAWLMTFPNSGTSYTLQTVSQATNTSVATNYARDITSLDMLSSLSIHPWNPEGPFWPGMSGKKINNRRKLPDRFVITKTHCGSRCNYCGPNTYITTPANFLRDCLTSEPIFQTPSNRQKVSLVYDPERVKRVIHLIRNPMHNIISRFHNQVKHRIEKRDKAWTDFYTNDAGGFHKWCEKSRIKYRKEDIQFFGSESKIPRAPCHGEFIKWTQWHNLAFESMNILQQQSYNLVPKRRVVPYLRVFYEDYTTNFRRITGSILDFLNLKQISPFQEFVARDDYDKYFTVNQLIDVQNLVESFAANRTWNNVKHYFEGSQMSQNRSLYDFHP